MSTTVFGQQLPEGEAKVLFERFATFRQTLGEDAQQFIPDAVCFNVTELQEYLQKVQTMFDKKRTDTEERGIAFFFGKHNGEVSKHHLQNKMTTVLVASRIKGNDEGRITAIESCVVSYGEFPNPGDPPDDLSYDTGHLDP